MIDLNQLKSFCAIVENGTISKAAEVLYTSQPALSRSMKQFEEELEVSLFIRTKNSIELNENGKLAYEFAKKLISDFNEYGRRLREFDKKNKTIAIGSCAPMPMRLLAPRLANQFPQKIISTQLKEEEALLPGLLRGDFQIIITSTRLEGEQVFSCELCTEKLFICAPEGHPLSKKTGGVYFAETGNSTFLLFSQIGFWEHIHKEKIPQARFIVQNNFEDFSDLVQESNLLSFTTDLAQRYSPPPQGKVAIPVLDEEATQTFYAAVLKKDKNLYHRVL